jgi:hypothetical protein
VVHGTLGDKQKKQEHARLLASDSDSPALGKVGSLEEGRLALCAFLLPQYWEASRLTGWPDPMFPFENSSGWLGLAGREVLRLYT